MEVADYTAYGEYDNKESVSEIMCGLVNALDDSNATFLALKEKFGGLSKMTADKVIPFASERKWSGAHFKNEGSYIMGAAEFILKEIPNDLKKYWTVIQEITVRLYLLIRTTTLKKMICTMI